MRNAHLEIENAHLQMRNAHLQIGMVFTSVHLEMCPHQTTGVGEEDERTFDRHWRKLIMIKLSTDRFHREQFNLLPTRLRHHIEAIQTMTMQT